MSKDTGGTILATIFLTPFALAIAIAIGAYTTFAEGYCASALWGWFAVPLGVRTLGWGTFAGASLLLSLSRLRMPKAEPEDTRSASQRFSAVFSYLAMPWILLAIGWCIK